MERVIRLEPDADRPRRRTARPRSSAAARSIPPKAIIQVGLAPLDAGRLIPWSVVGGCGFGVAVDVVVSRAATVSGAGLNLASALSIAVVEAASALEVGAGEVGGAAGAVGVGRGAA